MNPVTLSPITISFLVFCCVFGVGYLATFLRARLPEHHLSAETKDTVKLTMGLVATMTALILGLLVASAKGTYDAERSAVTSMAAKFVVLDRTLAHYGPGTEKSRAFLRHAVEEMVVGLWPVASHRPAQLDPSASPGDALYEMIEELAPPDDGHKVLKDHALSGAIELGQLRWLLFAQAASNVSLPLLAMVVCWLSVLSASFGLFAPANGTAKAALLVSSISVSMAILLILELDQPFDGLIQVPSDPLRVALTHLGK